MNYTTLGHVAYLKHPELGKVRVTWSDMSIDGEQDDKGMVWFALVLSDPKNGSDFLIVTHLEDSPTVGGYSILHHNMEGCYEKQRARLIWNALIRTGWTRYEKT